MWPMKRVVLCIVQCPQCPPGYFGTYMERHHAPMVTLRSFNSEELQVLLRIEYGKPFEVAGIAGQLLLGGLCLMGGYQSANDALPLHEWLFPFLRQCLAAQEVPVIGHCLGAQQMSRALGGVVSRAPSGEYGWFKLRWVDPAVAEKWLGADNRNALAYQWHGETFSIPPGGIPSVS